MGHIRHVFHDAARAALVADLRQIGPQIQLNSSIAKADAAMTYFAGRRASNCGTDVT
jgi:hypothetical protein